MIGIQRQGTGSLKDRFLIVMTLDNCIDDQAFQLVYPLLSKT